MNEEERIDRIRQIVLSRPRYRAINELLKQKFENNSNIYLRSYRPILEERFQKIKRNMIEEFLNHPVTKELNISKNIIDAPNISGTLSGITNLYSFIGFERGTDPIEPILNILERQTRIKFFPSQSMKNSILIQIIMPSSGDIFNPIVSKMPWDGFNRSWAEGIEIGISGLMYYIKIRSEQSKSGLGFQRKTRVRRQSGLKFKNVKYISAILRKYKKEFERIGRDIRTKNPIKNTEDFDSILS
jgi:hypothetical protein